METRRNRTWLFMLALAVLVSVGVVLVYSAMNTGRATAQGGCPDRYWESDDQDLVGRCVDEKNRLQDWRDAQAEMTATALRAYATPMIANFTPEVELEPPASLTKIAPVNPMDLAAGPVSFRNANTVWKIRSVPNSRYTSWSPIYIVSKPGNGAKHRYPSMSEPVTVNSNPWFETVIMNSDKGQEEKYQRRWESPRPVHTLEITNVEPTDRRGIGANDRGFLGLNMIVHFKTGTGETGTLDMVTETWTFDTPPK